MSFDGTVADITERKQAVEALHESEARFRALVTASSDVVYEMSADWSEMRRLEGREFIADTEKPSRTWFEEYIHPEDQPLVTATINEAIRTKSIYELEHRVRQVDGTLGWIFSRAAPLLDAKGEIVEWFGAVSDITARKETELALELLNRELYHEITERELAQEAMRESEERFRTLADTIPQLAWMAEPDGNIFWYNRGWYEYTGTTPEQMEGWGWQSVHDPEMLPKVVRQWNVSLATGEEFEMEFPLKGADGTFCWFLTRVNPLRDPEGRIVRWFGTNTDITERRQAQLNVEFLASVGDDLNQIADVDEMIRSVTTKIGEYMNLSACAFVHVNETEDTATITHDWHRTDVPGLVAAYSLSDYLADEFQKTLRDGEAFVIRDTATDPRTDTDSYAGLKIGSFVCMPAIKSGQWRFALGIYHSVAHDWRSDELELTRHLTDRIWARLERDRAEENERTHNRQLAVLNRSSQKLILGEEPLAVMLKDIFTDVAEAVGTEMFFHYTAGDEPGLMHLTNWGGITKEERDFFATMKFGEQFCGRVAERRERMIVEDLAVKEFPGGEVLSAAGVKAYAGFPLIAQERLIGTIAFVTRTRTKFSEGELLTIQTVCDHVAVTLDRFYGEEKLRKSEAEFRQLANAVPQIVWVTDASGVTEYVNDQWIAFSGLSLAETATPEIVAGVIHPDDHEAVFGGWAKALAHGTPFEIEGRMRNCKTLEYHWFLLRCVLIQQADGTTGRWFGTSTDISESKRVTEDLRESEERFSLAQEAGNVGIWDWDVATNQTYWSETMWRIYDAEQQNTNPDEAFWLSRIHADDRERVKLSVQQMLASTTDRHTDMFRIVQRDGGVRWIESIATVQRDESGNPVRMYGVDLDITEKKNIEERIRHSENQLRVITDSVPGLISYIDKDRRYRFVNKKYTEWFGITAEEFTGQHMREMLGAKVYKVLKPNVEMVLSGRACTIETTVPYKYAGERFVQFSYVPDFADDNSVRGFYVLVTDLTDRKLMEDLLRSSEERLSSLMESFTDYAIFSTDLDGRIESWNSGAENVFGYSGPEILGRPAEILFIPEEVAKGIPDRAMKTARKEGRAPDERWHVRKDGSRFFAGGEMTPLYMGGSLSGYAGICRDRTEAKRLADELQLAHDELEMRVIDRTKELAETNALLVQQMEERAFIEDQRHDLLKRLFTVQEDERGRIARDIHDQLGQRLTALRLKIESMKDLSNGNAEIGERIDHLQEIAEQLDREVSFVVWELRPTILDNTDFVSALRHYVEEWSRYSDIYAEFDQIKLTGLDLDTDIKTNLYRITQEALNNAAKHARADRINVLLEKQGDDLILIVDDNGRGFEMPENGIDRKLDKGFGLVGMRERAALISGTLEIESAKNKGTTVFVRVPLG